MQRRRRSISRRPALITACVALAYLLALAGILLIGPRMEPGAQTEPVGRLDGRYGAVPEFVYGGDSYRFCRGSVENYLIIGVDASSLSDAAGPAGNAQADFLLLMSADRREKRVALMLIDRDTMASVNVYGIFGDAAGKREMQICLAQAFRPDGRSGSVNTVDAVSRLLYGMPIAHYLTVDTAGIARLNDALGGVTVTLEEDFSQLDPRMTAGATLRLTGEQAELYVRSRTLVSDGTNQARMRRQSRYLEGLIRLLISAAAEDAGRLDALLDGLEAHAETDLSRGRLLNDVYTYAAYEFGELRSLAGVRQIGENGFAEFYVNEDAKAAMLIDLCFEKMP